jgi:hypothetical protein
MDPIKLIVLKECPMDLQDEEHLETQVVVVMITTQVVVAMEVLED